MAVDSSAVSSQLLKTPKKEVAKSQQDVPLSLPAKRNKSPGVRIVNGRIYDPVNGKTCHQCRQKTRDFAAACKNEKNNKPCTMMYCQKCLLNRYGEKVEEVHALREWNCPKCRGICNCSVCMKKKGHQPTGILVKTAKATGFSSVSEMLLKGAQHLNFENVVTAPTKEANFSSKKQGKENSFDGKVDANLPKNNEKKSKKVKNVCKGYKDDVTSINQIPDKRKLEQEDFAENHGIEDISSRGAEKSKKKKRDRSFELENNKDADKILEENSVNDVENKHKKPRKELETDDRKRNVVSLARITSPRKLSVSGKISKQEAEPNVGCDPDENMNFGITVTRKDLVKPLVDGNIKEDDINTANALVGLKQQKADHFPDIPMPLGTELNSAAGIDLSTEDVGNALQFLEFCNAFRKVLEVKKGEAEHVLRDLFHGRTGRRGKFSVTVQFHIHLLSILQTEREEECGKLSSSIGKSSWFEALKSSLSESQIILKAQGLDRLERAADYESLEASEKLKLLNILCDEILETEKFRTWMVEQNAELAEKTKEAKQKVIAAKDEEKALKQKMKDDVAKAIIAKHGAHLSISEHEAIISDFKKKAAEAHAKVLESKGMLDENGQSCNAIRTDPILVGRGGNAYWKLKSSGNSNILHQDVGKGDTLLLNEKWFSINDEGQEAIEKNLRLLRGKRLRF